MLHANVQSRSLDELMHVNLLTGRSSLFRVTLERTMRNLNMNKKDTRTFPFSLKILRKQNYRCHIAAHGAAMATVGESWRTFYPHAVLDRVCWLGEPAATTFLTSFAAPMPQTCLMCPGNSASQDCLPFFLLTVAGCSTRKKDKLSQV